MSFKAWVLRRAVRILDEEELWPEGTVTRASVLTMAGTFDRRNK